MDGDEEDDFGLAPGDVDLLCSVASLRSMACILASVLQVKIKSKSVEQPPRQMGPKLPRIGHSLGSQDRECIRPICSRRGLATAVILLVLHNKKLAHVSQSPIHRFVTM